MLRRRDLRGRMTDPLFIGVDGGATRTRARLRDARGNMLGEGSAGASKGAVAAVEKAGGSVEVTAPAKAAKKADVSE